MEPRGHDIGYRGRCRTDRRFELPGRGRVSEADLDDFHANRANAVIVAFPLRSMHDHFVLHASRVGQATDFRWIATGDAGSRSEYQASRRSVTHVARFRAGAAGDYLTGLPLK